MQDSVATHLTLAHLHARSAQTRSAALEIGRQLFCEKTEELVDRMEGYWRTGRSGSDA